MAGVAPASPATHSECCGLSATEDGSQDDRRMAAARAVGTDARWKISRLRTLRLGRCFSAVRSDRSGPTSTVIQHVPPREAYSASH